VNASGSYSNYAQVVASGQADPDSTPGNASTTEDDDDTLATVPVAGADLSLALTVSNVAPVTGSTIAYTVTVTNGGPSQATGVTVRDLLPAGYTFVSSVPTQGSYSSTSGDWTGITLNSGANARLRLNVTVNASGSYSNYAQVVASGQADPDSTPGNASTTEDDDDTLATAPSATADLVLAITDRPDPASVGGSLVYTLTVTNIGPSNAASLVLTDTLPAGVNYVSASGTSWTCATITGGRVRCTRPSLNAGASSPVVLTLTVNSSAVSPLNNSAVVRATTSDPGTANNSDTETTNVTTSANLGVTLTDTPDPVNAGANLTYNVTVSNAGPSDAVGVVFTNTLPANVAYQSFTGTGWSCTLNGVLVRCVRTANLVSGANDTVGIVARVNSSLTGGTLSDSVLVRSSTSDPVANNTAATTTTVRTSADLSVTKVDTVDPVEPGMGMAYVITVNNLGPSDAVGVRITDTLPTGVTYVTHVPLAEWTCSLVGGELRCSRVAVITSGGSAQINVAVMVGAGVTSTINNTARVGATTPDPVSGNNSDTESTTVTPRAELSLTKVESDDPIIAGTNLDYTLTASNDGPSTATSLVLTDTLPTNVTYQSYGGSSGWTCALLSGNRLRCTRASLAASGSSLVSVRVRVNPGVSGTINNTATVRSAALDSSLTDNTATASTTVNREADLSLSKTDSPDPVAEGQTLTYRVAVRNNGPSNAAAVSISDALPTTRVTYVSALSTQGTCSYSSPNVSCSLGAVTTGTTVTVTITTTARPVGDNLPKTASNTASVTTTTTDPDTANNSQTISTQVLPAADLRVNLASLVTTIQTGSPLTYTIWITNTGPSIATSVVVTDTLPAGLTFKSSSRTPAATSPKVVWNLGNMSANQSISFTLVVNVNSPTQTLVNSVAARSGTWDVVIANSQDTFSVKAEDSVVPTALWKLPVAAEGVYIVANQIVLLEVEAGDNVGVAYVRFYRWDSVLSQIVEIGNDTTASACQSNPAKLCYQWNLDTTVLRPKWNEIRAQAYDASNNSSPDGYRILLKYFSVQIYLPFVKK
jgi:uncharacterized repeat protein (TIGR01451 family)